MRLASLLRRSVYLAILVLLPLLIAGGSAGQALAGTPAARYVGADAYSKPTWSQADTPGSEYHIGPLQSEKFFYNGAPLPSSDAATTYQYGVPGCGATSGGRYVYPTTTLCIIVWNTAASTNGSDLRNFLKSTVHDEHQILMAFCNEAEGHQGQKGCVCDSPHLGQGPCAGASTFVSQFETESRYITAFEAANRPWDPNVHVAEISAGSYYSNNTGCSFIVPHQYVSHYLVDIYEGRKHNPISQPEELGQDPAWNNWVACTNTPDVSRGIAEFAINCGHEQKSLDGGAYEKAVAESFSEDNTYLKSNFPNLFVWNLWDDGGCALNNLPQDEPDSVAAWQHIAAGN